MIIIELTYFYHKVFEEVKMLSKCDLAAGVRRQVPELLNKLSLTPMFATGKQ